MEAVNLSEKFNLINEHWSPRLLGELNNQAVKIAKLKGEFTWHHHQNEDEMFFVIEGSMAIKLKDKDIVLNKNEFFGLDTYYSLRIALDIVCYYCNRRMKYSDK